MLRRLVEIERAIGHQVEGDQFHRDTSARKSRKGSIVSLIFSICGTCPHFSIMTSRASGRRSRQSPGIVRRHHLVLIAPDDERRQLDAMQPFLEIGIVPARLPAELGRGEAVLEHRIDLLLGRLQRERDIGISLVVEDVAQQLFAIPDEEIARGHALDADAGRGDERQALGAAPIANEDLGGDPAAERMADDVDVAQLERLEEIEIEHRHVGDVADQRRIVRGAEARMLGYQQLVLLGQRIEERQPLRIAVGAVQEEQRRAFAGAAQADADIADFHDLRFRRHARFSSPLWSRFLSSAHF